MNGIHFQHGDYCITSNKELMQVEAIHKWLSEEAYWSKGIPFHLVKGAFDHSFCVGALYHTEQVGFGRLLTDHCSFGYLADVYVLEAHRGKGIGVAMIKSLFDLDWVKGLRRIMLATRDAQELYKKVGFTALQHPERMMEIVRPGIYQQAM